MRRVKCQPQATDLPRSSSAASNTASRRFGHVNRRMRFMAQLGPDEHRSLSQPIELKRTLGQGVTV